jgi:hypothetical protein
MSSNLISVVLQFIVGAGLLNVWLLRAQSQTAYRGGSADSLRGEFETYGLPEWFFYLIGFLKIGSAIMLLAGIAMPGLVGPAASIVVGLMLGAIAMHIKVGDPAMKSLPAALMLLMSLIILYTHN